MPRTGRRCCDQVKKYPGARAEGTLRRCAATLDRLAELLKKIEQSTGKREAQDASSSTTPCLTQQFVPGRHQKVGMLAK